MNEAIKKIVKPNEQQDSLRSEEGKEKATEEVISSSKEGRKKLEKDVTLEYAAKKLRDLADEIDPTDRSESVALSSESQKKENPDPLQQTALEQNSAQEQNSTQENKDPSSSHTTLDNQTTSSPKEQLHSTTPAQNTKKTESSQDNLPPTKAEDSPEVSETPSTTSAEKQAKTPQNTQSEAPVSQAQQPTQAPSTNSKKNQPEESQSKNPVSEAPQPTQSEAQPQLSEAQKLAQVQQILGSFEAKFRNLQAESNSIAISVAELSSLDQLSGLLQQAPVLP